ncbi:MAG: hypothetical protein Ct9H300mP28_29130 [Pseudomonadota bacterium]|nr:MAG: hypothetical protein Ct9H300mP28_29130 [Pseudomonadota bacterium]
MEVSRSPNAYLDWNYSGINAWRYLWFVDWDACFKVKGAYLALFTLGFSEISATISAEIKITRGQAGIELPYLFEKAYQYLDMNSARQIKYPLIM